MAKSLGHQCIPRAITVCVDYSDFLAVTLPYNRQHYSEYWVVTTDKDKLTHAVAEQYNCRIYSTDSFFKFGPNTFAKWCGLEEGLKMMGKHGWINILDADILLPKNADFGWLLPENVNTLTTPLRHMYDTLYMRESELYIPKEQDWWKYKLHHNQREWAGFCQIFHASAKCLQGEGPWFEQNWQHCGGADSIFQDRWCTENKIRPTWNVLHLGETLTNWFGRASQRLDGTIPQDCYKRAKLCQQIWRGRIEKGRPARSALS